MHDYRQNAFTGNMESSDKEDFNIVPKNQPHYVRLREVPLKEVPTTIAVRFLAFVTDANITAAATIINMDFDLSTPFKAGDVLTIDSEKIKISNISGGAVTVVRGYESLAVPHARTDTVTPIVAYGPLLAEVGTDPASGQYQPDYTAKPNGDETWNTGELRFNSADAHKWVQIKYTGIGSLSSAERSGNNPLRNYGHSPDKSIYALLSGTTTAPDRLIEAQIVYVRKGSQINCAAPGLIVRATSSVIIAGGINASAIVGTHGYGGGNGGYTNNGAVGWSVYYYESIYTLGNAQTPSLGLQEFLLSQKTTPLFSGSKGAIDVNGAGAGGGGVTCLSPYIAMGATGWINCNGSGGGSIDWSDGSAPGGGGGGVIILSGERIVREGIFYVNGGAAGYGRSNARGYAGGAGWVKVIEHGGRT